MQLSGFDKTAYELVLVLVSLGALTVISALVVDSAQPLPQRLQIYQDFVPAFYIWGSAAVIWVLDTLIMVRRRIRTISSDKTTGRV